MQNGLAAGIRKHINTLMRGVFAGNMAFVAVDAVLLINPCHHFVIQIQIAPVGVFGHRFADQLRD
ncbi:hypothetical protein D3C76_1611780 [compost metagenome]